VINGSGDVVNGTVNEDFAVTADLTVDDVESGTGGVTVTTSSSDTTLIPNANVLISGSGSARKLTIIPAANLSSAPLTSVTITITANDNSGLGNSITTHTLNFQVLSVNDAPQFTKGVDLISGEDQSLISVPNWSPKLDPGAANESGQTVSLLVTSVSNPGLFSLQPSFAGNTLTYTAAPNQDGSALITVVAKDSGGTLFGGNDTSAPQSFLITVTAFNDQPSFNLTSPITTPNEDCCIGLITAPGLVTAIDPGAGGAGSEGSQTLTFVIANDHPEYFKTQPSIKINGTTGDLTYEPNTNAFGLATLQIKLVDNGGTAFGGVDTSVTKQFIIEIFGTDDVPTISTIPNVTTGKGTDSAATLFTVNDPDITNPASLGVTFSHVSGPTIAQNFSVGVSGGTRALIITPVAGLTGLPLTETISASVTDVNSGLPFYLNPPPFGTITTTFTFTVTDLNNPPTISTLNDFTTSEVDGSLSSSSLSITLPGLTD
jgi:hypothetical protein